VEYRLTVRGHLSERFCRVFEGLRVEHVDGDTALAGELPDVSALYGLIERFRDLGLELVSLEQVAP
jgi:hypothetical protein